MKKVTYFVLQMCAKAVRAFGPNGSEIATRISCFFVDAYANNDLIHQGHKNNKEVYDDECFTAYKGPDNAKEGCNDNDGAKNRDD